MRVFLAVSALIAFAMISYGLLASNDSGDSSSDVAGTVEPTAESFSENPDDTSNASATPEPVGSGNFDDSDERCFAGDASIDSVISGRTIIIDPGHGGEDLGTVNQSFDLTESGLVLTISLDLRDRLVADGANVCLTRTDDYYVELAARAEFANEIGGDAFVSMHLNSLPDPTQNYTMTMWGNEAKDRFLSEMIVERMRFRMATPEYHQGEPNPMSPDVFRMRDLDSTMLRNAEMPATLVEASFLSSTWEAQAFASGIEDGSRWREQQIARTVHLGLEDFFGSFQ
ncbi:MAG: N-acetylmuramoyl-L-alanine amidase [Sphaerobacteraceae bacterium]|nr:MAG: N-acetylmuramoyl-L-alanine amidase [Sphaerobacteraceae bacterium]